MMAAAHGNILHPTPKWLAGMNVLNDVRGNGVDALSDIGACLMPLLEALEWNGRERHLAEAIPHFLPNLDLHAFRDTLANLNLSTRPLRVRHDQINPNLMPCLFIPENAALPVRVILGTEAQGYRVYDGAKRFVRYSSGIGVRGTAYVVKKIESGARAEQHKNQSWASLLAGRFRRLIWQVISLTLLFNILSLAMPIFMMSIYDTIIPSASVNQLLYLLAGVALAISLETALRRLRVRAMAYLAGRVDYLVGRAAFERVLFLPLAMLEHEPLGAQMTHLREFESLREFFAGPLGEALLDLPFVVIYLAAIAILGGWLVLVPICAAIALVLSGLVILAFTEHFSATGNEYKAEQQEFLVQAVSGMRAIKFAGSENVWLQRYRDLAASTALREFAITRQSNAVLTVSRVVGLASGIAIMGFGALGVMDDTITIGALIACMALVWRTLSPLQSGFMTLNRLSQIKSSVHQINRLMRLPTESIPGQMPYSRALTGRLVFNGVAHRFSNDAELALLGVSFTIEPGEVVAITGPNGSGKSTLINLVAGLYHPTMGTILIDGIDVRQIDPIDLRQSIALAPQSTELIYGTVAQNLLLADPTASDEDLIDAAKLAGAYDGVMRLPQQFDTQLNELVLTEMTEGFKQKLSLARAYLKKAPIMLFDEPGQALDEEGDLAFIATIQKLRGSATIIIVTHRPSHIEIADRLLILEGGRLQYNGRPQEAMDRLSGGAQ